MRQTLSLAALVATALSVPALPVLTAQDTKPAPPPRVQILRSPNPALLWTPAADRAVLGVTLGASTRADTAGVRIDDVDANGPAAKAGLKAGDVITEINGVSLRVAVADAEDLALAGVAQRRLQRTMAKAKPGDEIDLRVRSGGAARAVKVKTVSARDLQGTGTTRARLSTSNEAPHAAIGVSIGTSGSVRDTLGLFVSSVVGAGPAEKAGIVEGERIAAVNGVDVRVPREDVEDGTVASARVERFVKEVQKLTPGASITLKVYGNGRYRDVTVASVKASELPSQGFSMSAGDRGIQIFRRGSPTSGEPMILDNEAFNRAMEQLQLRLNDLPVRIRSGLTRM